MKKQYLQPIVDMQLDYAEDIMSVSGNDPWGDDIYAPQNEFKA